MKTSTEPVIVPSTEPVIGLTIQLKKYGIKNNSTFISSNGIKCTMLGHYDSLEIYPVNKWLDFSPDTNITGDDATTIPQLKTYYPIKLLFPDITKLSAKPYSI